MGVLRRLIRSSSMCLALCLLLAGVLAQAQTFTYFHNDPSGTPVLATDSAGNVVWKESYRPYGDRLVNAPGASNNALGYAGKPGGFKSEVQHLAHPVR